MHKVLDKGYVRFVDKLGTDLTVANSARVSFNKRSDAMTERDEKLIKFLWKNKHYSPFRHCALTLEVSAPLVVKNQWWKHVVASSLTSEQQGWNEISHRYVAEADEFHVPNEWRAAPKNSKQGSGGAVETDTDYSELLNQHIESSRHLYNKALADGIAPEQARLFLPGYALYVKWYWTASLEGLINFINLRTAGEAQYEIRQYAFAVKDIVEEFFPVTMNVVFGSNEC